jgi:hypothetical protein
MTCRALFRVTLLALVLVSGVALGPHGQAQEQIATLPGSAVTQSEQAPVSPPVGEFRARDRPGLPDDDFVAAPRPPFVPDDPCLPPLYKNWYEFSADVREEDAAREFVGFRVLLDRSTFVLKFQGLRRDGSIKTIYASPCGVGELNSPTPEGRFLINHVYIYPDVAFFGSSGDPHRGLYNGFFAPLLVCDDDGLCQRFQELGIHGFNPSAYPDPSAIRLEACGAVSGGCVRLPDPCRFKTALIRLVGIGPAKRNDRGVYHWLNKPVEVLISGDYPGANDFGSVASLFEQGLIHVRDGLKNLIGSFGP